MSFEQEDNEDEVIDDEEHFDETLDVGLEPAELSSIEFDGISLAGASFLSNRLLAIWPSSFFSECIGHFDFDLFFCCLYCLLAMLFDSLSLPFFCCRSAMNFH